MLTGDVSETSLVSVSRSRLSLLSELADRRGTASELARRVDLNKSTVHCYLQELVEDGLVCRQEREDRLWVYYDLSALGRKILADGEVSFVVDMDTSNVMVEGLDAPPQDHVSTS